MNDIRIKKETIQFDGRDIVLCCNMNVLADVQEAYGGNINGALRGATVKSLLHFLTAMINDHLDSSGDAQRYTVREVGRLIPPADLKEITQTVMGLVTSALQAAGGEEGKNGITTQRNP